MNEIKLFVQKAAEITGDEFTRVTFEKALHADGMRIQINWNAANGKAHGFMYIRPNFISQTFRQSKDFESYVLGLLKAHWDKHREECECAK